MKWPGFAVVVLVLLTCLFLIKNMAGKPESLLPASTEPTTPPVVECNAIKVTKPLENAKITSPLSIEAVVDNSGHCSWTVFEAQAGEIELKDEKGEILGQSVLKTTQDWMSNKPTTYTGKISFKKPAGKNATLLIHEENPSGRPGSKTVIIPVTL